MAASSRQSSSRKRTAEPEDSADHSPIVQLSHAQLCGCDCCWWEAVVRPGLRRSARLQAAKSKPTETLAALDHERQASKNFFVYECPKLINLFCFSADGRYLYALTKQGEILVVDLQRNVHRLWKSPTKKSRSSFYCDQIVTVSPSRILANTLNGDSAGLLLIRLPDDSAAEVYEETLPHSTAGLNFTFVLTEINGGQVDVERAVLGCSGRLVFFTLDLDEPRATVQQTSVYPTGGSFISQVSKDGTRFSAVNHSKPKELHVYSLDERKWTKETLGGVAADSSFSWFTSPTHCQFAEERGKVDGTPTSFLVSCNFEAKQWEAVALCPPLCAYLYPIVNPADGGVDGIVTIERLPCFEIAHDFGRLKIERVMFRNSDSLRTLAVTAAHKSRELIDREGGFQHEMNVAPLKCVLPSFFEGMKPIPVRQLQ